LYANVLRANLELAHRAHVFDQVCVRGYVFVRALVCVGVRTGKRTSLLAWEYCLAAAVPGPHVLLQCCTTQPHPCSPFFRQTAVCSPLILTGAPLCHCCCCCRPTSSLRGPSLSSALSARPLHLHRRVCSWVYHC